MDTVVTARKPFGLATNAVPTNTGDLTLRYNKGFGKYKRKDIKVGIENIDKWKVIISYLSAEHAGQPDKNGMFRILSTSEILPPKSVCTETYLLAGCYDTKAEADNQLKYLKTKFLRFLVWQIAVSQHITRNCFSFAPVQNTSPQNSDLDWSVSIADIDKQLYKKYGLTQQEIDFIESHVKEMV